MIVKKFLKHYNSHNMRPVVASFIFWILKYIKYNKVGLKGKLCNNYKDDKFPNTGNH